MRSILIVEPLTCVLVVLVIVSSANIIFNKNVLSVSFNELNN